MNNKSHLPCQNVAEQEGKIYKKVTTYGKTFELRYGYYDDDDRKWGEPDIIYPDFIKEPLYTEDGEPFVTLVQDACDNFVGKECKNSDSTCGECELFEKGEEWFGICICPINRKKDE